MYNLRFEKSNGESFYFDVGHRVVFDLDPLSELDVDIATSQGVAQLGSSVENRSVGGIEREIRGHIIGYANDIKRQMINIFAPFSEGKLYFNEKYYCDCVVKQTPAIGSATRDVGFSIVLYSAYPFWLDTAASEASSTTYTPCFMFPGPTSAIGSDYGSHIYATRNDSTFFNVYNDSDIAVRFEMTITTATGPVSNYGAINVRTLERLQLNDTLLLGEKVRIYWDGARLRVEKDGEDIFSLLDEGSGLFRLYPGDNVLLAFADDGFPDVRITYRQAYVGVYDGK